MTAMISGRDGYSNLFNENIVAAPKLTPETHNHLEEISADETLQPQFTSEDLD